MPCVHEALENSDWATRKAAAETLGRICNNPGHDLASFRSVTLSSLESCRFDKVRLTKTSLHLVSSAFFFVSDRLRNLYILR